MTGYHARWKTAGIERGRIRTYARTLRPVDEPLAEEPTDARQPVGEPHASDNVAPLRVVPPPSNVDAAPSMASLDAAPAPSPDTSSDDDERPERAAKTAATVAPDDFSDLIALAGPAALDDGYHDYPAALHTTVASRRGHSDGPSTLLLDNENADPLLTLAAEYEQALLHEARGERHQLTTNADPAERTPVARPPSDPFDDVNLAPSSQSLLDLLVAGQNIDTLLDSLDPFGAERIFEGEKRHEILSLLASPTHVAQRTSPTAQLAREEHHLISVDSHIDVLATQSDEAPPDHEDQR